MIQPERIHGKFEEGKCRRGTHVLYWMQDAVRTEGNHALEYAIDAANVLKKPLLVHFCLTDSYPDANVRHYMFLAEGLSDVAAYLSDRGIRLQVSVGNLVSNVVLAAEDACLLVTEYPHLRLPRRWRLSVLEMVSCPMIAIETGVIVPTGLASPKMDWSAGTFRPKITKHLSRFLVPVEPRVLHISSLGWDDGGIPVSDPASLLAWINPDSTVQPVSIRGGQTAAKAQLSWFISKNIDRYDDARNDPTARATSRLSPYLHFGQLSPLTAALSAITAKSPGTSAFIEQLVVRRELATNFVFYNEEYFQYESAVPDWSKKTLSSHRGDRREYEYSLSNLEAGKTHDPYWNAMQTEMRLTGSLHGYLRMYWGKKIIEWSETPEEAFESALFLNNRYQLDGRDPNGYTGVAWCFGRHDRPWKERPIFGMIRYMNNAGLKRKFRIDAYCERIEIMAAEHEENSSHNE